MIRHAAQLAAVCVLARPGSQTAPGSTNEIRKPDKTIAGADVARVAAVAFNPDGSIVATGGEAEPFRKVALALLEAN
jgi:hypothetical protein